MNCQGVTASFTVSPEPKGYPSGSLRLRCVVPTRPRNSAFYDVSVLLRNATRTSARIFEALERLINGASKDMRTEECIISSLAAVAAIQVGDISEEQSEFMHGFRELPDMKPSQFQQALQRGIDLAVALDYSARQYAKSGRL